MSAKENKAIMGRVVGEVFNKGNLAIIPELIAPNYVYHGSVGMEAKGPEGFKQFVTWLRTAFPDFHMKIDDLVAEGDKVVNCYRVTGTHKGEFMGIAPTGKKVTVSGIVITRWVGGKEVEAWGVDDMLAMMQQLGVVPPMGKGGR